MDHNATTAVLPEVLAAMTPYFTSEWGNPSSAYKFGSKLKGVIERAREQVADLIGATPPEITFTSCATESNNAAIHAALKANPCKRHTDSRRNTTGNACILCLCDHILGRQGEGTIFDFGPLELGELSTHFFYSPIQMEHD